jgi:hypothetical protein
MVSRTGAAETAIVLMEDAELAETVAAERRDAAVRAARARVLRVDAGTWDARHDAEITRHGYGFLVLGGLLIRRVGIGERIGAELASPRRARSSAPSAAGCCTASRRPPSRRPPRVSTQARSRRTGSPTCGAARALLACGPA